jgi:hypothetical protein
VSLVAGDVAEVRERLHEEGCYKEESEDGSDEAKCFKIFFRDEGLILFVHWIRVIIVYKSIN